MTRIPDEKVVAGVSCSEVLDRLSDYLDGDLAPEERRSLELHLAGCEGCARFGGELRATVRALRARLAAGPGLPPSVRERLRRSLDDGDAGRGVH